MKKTTWQSGLSRRERQVMDVLLAGGETTAAEIRSRVPEPPSYSAIRALLRVMEEKGLVTHFAEGPRYIYRAAIPQEKARRSAIEQMLQTFFHGSREALVAALFDPKEAKMDRHELDRLAKLIEEARKGGR